MKKQQRNAKAKSDEQPLTILGGNRVHYPASPEEATLETFPSPKPGRPYRIRFVCPEFTTMCPVTGQPDFGTIDIEYVPAQRCVESKSLKLYLFSFRNRGNFGEAVVNRILDDLVRACAPRYAKVTGSFTPRGGITMTVVAEHPRPRP